MRFDVVLHEGLAARRMTERVLAALLEQQGLTLQLEREVQAMSEQLDALKATVTQIGTLVEAAVARIAAPPTLVGDDQAAVGAVNDALKAEAAKLYAALNPPAPAEPAAPPA